VVGWSEVLGKIEIEEFLGNSVSPLAISETGNKTLNYCKIKN